MPREIYLGAGLRQDAGGAVSISAEGIAQTLLSIIQLDEDDGGHHRYISFIYHLSAEEMTLQRLPNMMKA